MLVGFRWSVEEVEMDLKIPTPQLHASELPEKNLMTDRPCHETRFCTTIMGPRLSKNRSISGTPSDLLPVWLLLTDVTNTQLGYCLVALLGGRENFTTVRLYLVALAVTCRLAISSSQSAAQCSGLWVP